VCGTAAWIAIATIARLPVSTTHAIVGSLIGAGVLFSPATVSWSAIGARMAIPLLASVGLSFGLSAALNWGFSKARSSGPDCLCVGVAEIEASGVRIPVLHAATCTASDARPAVGSVRLDTRILHWLSSGAVGFARGLNDTPKLVAMGAGLTVAGISTGVLLLAVSGAMFAGSLVGGLRVARVLGENVVRMNDREGLMASLATALLVGAGANFGLPMSTTHVSTGAIAGIAGRSSERLNRGTARDLLLAWGVTPFVSATIAAMSYWAVS
jgi:PiT family inorganic phosphate transporter